MLLTKLDGESGASPATDEELNRLTIPHDGDRLLVQRVLDISRALLDNCSNRSLYSSSGRLHNLLGTTSMPLLKATLRLALRLAQRFHASRSRTHTMYHNQLASSHYNISVPRIERMAVPFAKASPGNASAVSVSSKGKEKASSDRRLGPDTPRPSDLIGLASGPAHQPSLISDFAGVMLAYYEPPASESQAGLHAPKTSPSGRRASTAGPSPLRQQRPADEPPASPSTPLERAVDAAPLGLKTLMFSPDEVVNTDIHTLLKKACAEQPNIPSFEVLHKLRVAQALASGKAGREEAVAVRLLAVANLAYFFGESAFDAKIAQPDSDEPRHLQLAYQLAELVHAPLTGELGISRDLQTIALDTLEALTKLKSKAGDVCTALNVNMNHGVLFYVLREAVAELASDQVQGNSEDEWREALFALVNSLPTAQPRIGEAMVSAGLLEILVDVLRLRTNLAEWNHPKVLSFLDTFVYNLRDAFSALVNAKGLDVVVDLTAYSVERAEHGPAVVDEVRTPPMDYQIPFLQQQTLRWLLKFINHMMSKGDGNFDRVLRNLMESPPLLNALRHHALQRAQVWSYCVEFGGQHSHKLHSP